MEPKRHSSEVMVVVEPKGRSSEVSKEKNIYYLKDTQTEDVKSDSREVFHRKAEKNSLYSHFYVSETYESLDYIPITNQLELTRQRTHTFGSVLKEDCLRLLLYVLTGILTAVLCTVMETFIHTIGYFKYETFNIFVIDNFQNVPHDFAIVCVLRFMAVLVPVMIGTAVVIYVAPYTTGGGVAQCIAYLNGIRVPRILSVKGMVVKFVSVICVCVVGLAGGKEGPAMHFGAIIGGGIPSCFPWLQLRSDHERRDIAAAGFGAGIAVVFGAPIGGMLLSLEEGVSFWDIGLMWKMYLCCIVCYGVGSICFSLFLGVKVRLNNPELSILGEISVAVTKYELFELLLFALQAVIGGILGSLLIKLHIYVYMIRTRFVNTNCRKLLLSFFAAVVLTFIEIISIRLFRQCSKLSEDEIKEYANDSLTRRSHQLYCDDDEHSDMSLLFEQTQVDILRSFFGTHIIQATSLAWFVVVYFFLLILTWSLTMSYGVFIPQIIFGAAWGRLFGTLLQNVFPDSPWTNPAKYAYIGATAQLGASVGKTFSVLVIMVEASGSINFAFPLMVVVSITKFLGTFFVVPIYRAQMLLMGLPFLHTKPPPLSLDIPSSAIMSRPLITLPPSPTVKEIADVIKTTSHHGFPVVDRHKPDELLGLILRQQLLVLLKYKAYKYPPPKTRNEMLQCQRVYLKLARKRLDNQGILSSVKPKYYNTTIDLTLYYEAYPATVTDVTPAMKAYSVFRNMALRHLVVTANNVPVGMITRKDLAKFQTFESFFRVGVTEILVKT